MATESIDVDGCRLSTRITGSGTPAAVMLSTAGGGHAQWERLVPLLPTTSVTYGRPGLDRSDPLVGQPAAGADHDAATRQLRALLRTCGIPPPYVLVSGSLGAYLADRFAVRSPQDVAGLVFLDPTPITPLPLADRADIIDDADGRGLRLSRERCRQLLEAELPPPSLRAVVVSRADGTVPREVIERYWQPLMMPQADREWRIRQQEWARRLDAVHIRAATAGHVVQEDQPTLVAMIVDAVARAARRDAPLDLSPDDVAAAGGMFVRQLGPADGR